MSLTRDQKLGAVLLVAVILGLWLWIPADVDSGLFEKVRRRMVIGDALAPTLAFVIIGLASFGMLFSRREETELPKINWLFQTILLSALVLSFLLMRYLGPWFTDLVSADSYRNLRDTAPWNLISFTVGGTLLIFVLASLTDHSPSWKRLVVCFVLVLVITLLYDFSFDSLLLPPNGDV